MEKNNKRLVSILNFNIKKLLVGVCLSTAFLFFSASKTFALSLIFDEETNDFIYDISRPLYNYSQITFDKNKIFIVNDASMNAFVADGNDLFIHTGSIIKADNANELTGVIAHELGHIKGGHIIRGKLKSQSLQKASIASMLVASSLGALTGRADVAMAILLGTQSSSLNSFMSYRVDEERAADEYAMKALHATNQSGQGMLAFMNKINQDNKMSGISENPYFRTHPVTIDRMSFFKNYIKNEKMKLTVNKKFDNVKAKLYAYLNTPKKTYKKYSSSSVASLYAQSIAKMRELKFAESIVIIKKLIQLEPKNPYFYEILAEVYTQQGILTKAENAYRQSLLYKKNSSLIKISLAHNLIEQNKDLSFAIILLKQSIIDLNLSYSWNLLSRAYGLQGDSLNAQYSAAEFSYLIEKPKLSLKQAQNVLENPKITKSLKLKIEDLISRVDEKIKKR